MKNIIPLVFLCLPFVLRGQWQPINSSGTDSGDIYHLNGRVGVGTTAPITKLSVYDINQTPVLNVTGNAGYNQVVSELRMTNYYETLPGHRVSIKAINDSPGSQGSMALQFNTSIYDGQHYQVEAMRIASNGRVGIGTVSPNNNLDVMSWFGAGTETSCFVGQDHNFGANGGRYGIGLSFEHLDGTNQGKRYHLNTWFAGSIRRTMTFGYSGNVGIGTTNPTEKLEVNGTVYSKEVKVDLDAGSGPDYVFAPSYQLPTLEEVKAYIDQYQHLPEVPSAKEMEVKGVNLGEMNMLLLKKIEELTLYMIEQNKSINLQQQEIVQLKEMIKSLTSKN